MVRKKKKSVDWESLLVGISSGKTVMECSANSTIFSQGEAADSVFYLRRGKVKLVATSQQGKEAIVAVLGSGDFFGEGCLAGQPLRIAAAAAMTDCTLAKVEKAVMARLLHELHNASEMFIMQLLSRGIRSEEDLVAQLFNSSEKRLARKLLLLAHFDKNIRTETIVSKIYQEDLARTIGTTQSRISHYMNKFRTQGFIDFSDDGGLTVHNGLLSVVLCD
jgi:CRP/FNR family cyclic AMP-dependent transcriptional regulator